MIERYTRPKMGKIWAVENRFRKMLLVEIAVAKAQARLRLIPRAAAAAIAKKGRFQVDRILEIEATTKHDVIAFVSNVAENVGEYGRFVHFGMTSSDVLDTALSLQIRDAVEELSSSLERLDRALERLARRHSKTLCAGRTHGMHAEVTSFGLKMAGHLMELRRNVARLEAAAANLAIGKISGAVGTYSSQPREVESGVCKELKLRSETVATQVIPRDRHAEMLNALALIGAGLERLAVELRHLQRTEVGEVTEGFTPGQKGSSAMPHKKNPISAENLTGMARLLRSYAQAGMENVALWHERDISHSGVERVVFPDAFIVCDYAVDRMATVLSGLYVDKQAMAANMKRSGGQLWSSQVLLFLVNKGFTREDAYKLVQKAAHGMKPGDTLRQKLLQSAEFKSLVKEKVISTKEVNDLFSERALVAALDKQVKRALSAKG